MKSLRQKINATSVYQIKEIRNKNSWYIIYTEKKGVLYKVIVKKDNLSSANCKKITVGNYYKLDLKSRREHAPKIGGVELQPMNYLDVECFTYDEETEICIGPEKEIYDLYYTDDLKGLCYLK